MLLCQVMVVAAVKRCDAVVLHAWTAAKEMARSIRRIGSDGECTLAD